MNRVLSVTQARSLYLKTLAESKQCSSNSERAEAKKQVNRAVRALQQAQLTQRLRGSGRGIVREQDWNEEVW